MLPNTLVTNEVKNAAGTEVEFQRLDGGSAPRSVVYSKIGETYAYKHRLTIKHDEQGEGLLRVRRSLVRFDIESAGEVDTTAKVTTSAYMNLVVPVGNQTATTKANEVIANLLSFSASLGASTTILYDGTGNGAAALIAGSL